MWEKIVVRSILHAFCFDKAYIGSCARVLIVDVISSGMSMPIAHVEESWQAAEFYNNKVL